MARRTPDAVVLTSDSDLLLYDIGCSSVIFLDDIVLSDRHTAPPCFTFSPLFLEARLKLPGTDPAHALRRFAFELVKTPNASFPQLLARCKRPASEREYSKFDQQYRVQQSISPLPTAHNSNPLDSRLSELFLQCSSEALCPPHRPDFLPGVAARFFLPNMLENYGRSSCFEPSSEIRQLAYSLLSLDADGQVQGVWEFKRLHVLAGRGTYVPVLPPSGLPQATRDWAAPLSHVSSHIGKDCEYFWPAIALELDARYSRSEGKARLAPTLAGMGQCTSEMTPTVPWDLVHFKAQVDACCYSFRILGQVLSVVRPHLPPEDANTIYGLLQPYISRVPSLRELPTMERILKFLSSTLGKSLMTRMPRALGQQDIAPQAPPAAVAAVKAGKRNPGHQQAFGTRNRFGVLLDAEE
ncbi:uncharacterized protein DNG_05872 [Cephalotrichum gorgonifer]|uniref:Asteroid domain-containing protein n=1 Tax=Cephalotrichum gorgonifer TaxID=2041049 RepID=A0AAE8N1J1_9PEZI|nr:uncharacterized protein DNG_05872 [Cephalotrichum gorgonifer]